MVTIEELIQRATAGQRPEPRALFRPSLVYQVLHDPFWIWCEYHAPRSEAVDETSRYDELRRQRGVEYEQAWVREHFPHALRVVPDFGFEALRNTLQAMREGVPAIYGPQIWDLEGETYGKGDLLVRDDTHPSDLGPYHYRVVEIKQARTVQDHHVLQAAFYNRILGKLQGYAPGVLSVAVRESTEVIPVALSGTELDEILTTWKALRDGAMIPEPGRPPDVTDPPWRVYGQKLVESRKDLVLLAGVGARERERLRAAGIQRVDQLWPLRLDQVCEMLGEQSGVQAYYGGQAYRSGLPIPRSNARLRVPRAARHLYVDFETSDEVHPTEPAHVYLVGVWDAERRRHDRFVARGALEEARIFEEFLAYVGEGEGVRLYHWADFEPVQMVKVGERWPRLSQPLERLLARCVDLMRVVKSAVYLPVPSFSLKCVAPALGFQWRQEGFGAFEAMVCYWDYLQTGDESAIAKAVVYNEDDCHAMWHVDHELTRRFCH